VCPGAAAIVLPIERSGGPAPSLLLAASMGEQLAYLHQAYEAFLGAVGGAQPAVASPRLRRAPPADDLFHHQHAVHHMKPNTAPIATRPLLPHKLTGAIRDACPDASRERLAALTLQLQAQGLHG
jgi:hypothetical protein